MHINKIEPWYDPSDSLKRDPEFKCKMSREDHGFISGVIKKFRPKKVLEVGVDRGGTTAMIIKSLEMLGCNSKIFGVDIDVTHKSYNVGFLTNKIMIPRSIDFTLLTGKLLIDRLEEIGDEIDMVILDTIHQVPGEIFEFLTILPFLSKNGIVILHDVDLSSYYASNLKKIALCFTCTAPKVLFPAITGEKFYNYNDERSYNIAAVRINEDTFNNIGDVFFTLTNLWSYKLKEGDIEKYRKFFQKHYTSENLKLYDISVSRLPRYINNLDKVKTYLYIYSKNYRIINRLIRIRSRIKKKLKK